MQSSGDAISRLGNALGDIDLPRRPCSVLGAITGEGVGSEVVPAALAVLKSASSAFGLNLEVRRGAFEHFAGTDDPDAPLPDNVRNFCQAVFADNGAVLCGPVGGRFVYQLRRTFDLFCKFVPLKPLLVEPAIGCLAQEQLRNVDIMLVRENVSGAYFGEWSGHGSEGACEATHHFRYAYDEVERIIAVGCRLAEARSGRLCLVVKRNGVPTISALWEDVLARNPLAKSLEVEVQDIDNAVYQLIRNPRNFDVVVAPNMFGDILGDCGALLLGTRGASFSGNFGSHGRSVFQTAHGAAFDIAGRDVANPVGQILSLAMMLRERFDAAAAARAIEDATCRVLRQGYRTADMPAPGRSPIGTQELADRIAGAVQTSAAAA